MRARIYIRVSTDEQAQEGYSLAAQEDRCRQFIDSQGWEFTGVYKDDGYSAKDLKRPAMQQLISDVENKEFDVLVVYRLDRLVRSTVDLHYLLELLDKHQVMFKSTTESFDTTTAAGRLFISLTGSIAQWERENLAERVKVGMERMVLEGKRAGGRAPYGYQIHPVTGELVIDEEEARVVRMIFKLYRRMGIQKIAHTLNRRKIKARSADLWRQKVIGYILENPVYIGHTRWNQTEQSKTAKTNEVHIYENTHEPIIDEKTFYEIQELMKERRSRLTRSMTGDYPFSSVLICGRCGSTFSGNTVTHKFGRVRKYRCRRRHELGACDLPLVDERSILEAFFSNLEWVVTPKDIDEVDTQLPAASIEDRRKKIEAELEKIKKRRRKWQFAFANEAITIEELKELTGEDRKREEELQEELLKLPKIKERKEVSKEELFEQINSLREVWPELSPSDQKEVISTIFERLVIDIDELIGGWPRKVKIVEFELKE